MDSIIVGTAGHVDHGKTMLIKALTGKDTDRLREEKERGISIDLGFAPFTLPSGRLAGIVDVPGHERFIHNMLAGIGGIDVVILVVDASEGVMPQTREHLEIMQLLEINKGIVVITKIDLVEEEWLELVEEEIKEEFKGTFLEEALIHRVSVVDGTGIEELKDLLDKISLDVPSKDQEAPLRIPVDRIFSVSGFGTIITGTLLSGTVAIGETVQILPSRLEARIRQIQLFGETTEKAVAGHRVALNMAGIEKDLIERGDVVVRPGFFKDTTLIDARLNLLPEIKNSLVNMAPVHLYLGAKRLVAKILLLEKDELLPGESTLVQCRLDRAVVAHSGDRFIIRSYSPMTTIGGGVVLDGHPAKHKRFKEDVIKRLKVLEEGDPVELILQKLAEKKFASVNELRLTTKLPEDILNNEVDKLIEAGRIVPLSNAVLNSATMEEWKDFIIKSLQDHYRKNNLSTGLSKAQLKNHLSTELNQKDYDSFLGLLQDMKLIEIKGETISFYGHEAKPSPKEEDILQKIEELHLTNKFSPPVRKEITDILKTTSPTTDNLISYLLEKGILVKISEDFFLHRESFNECVKILREYLDKNGEITVSEFRTLLGTSRKYALPLLESFDQRKLIRRVEDKRVPWRIKETGEL